MGVYVHMQYSLKRNVLIEKSILWRLPGIQLEAWGVYASCQRSMNLELERSSAENSKQLNSICKFNQR
jgi:hypothetical protein